MIEQRILTAKAGRQLAREKQMSCMKAAIGLAIKQAGICKRDQTILQEKLVSALTSYLFWTSG